MATANFAYERIDNIARCAISLVMRTGNRIRRWRKNAGLSQEELGARVGLSTSMISRLEGGKVPYMQHHLEAIAQTLGCEPADLLERNPVSKEAAALIALLNRASPTQTSQILTIARTLVPDDQIATKEHD